MKSTTFRHGQDKLTNALHLAFIKNELFWLRNRRHRMTSSEAYHMHKVQILLELVAAIFVLTLLMWMFIQL